MRERLAGLGQLGSDLLLPSLGGYRAGELADANAGGETADPPEPGGGRPSWGPAAKARPCTTSVRWRLVAEPGMFVCHPARVEVETEGRWTTGMTVTDFRAPVQYRNALVATSVDVDRFWDTAIGAWARVPAAQRQAVG